MLLQSAATLIPVPLIQETIGVVIKIYLRYARLVRFCPGKDARSFSIYYCQNVSAVQQKVKELGDRVCHLMVVIVDNVTSKNEEGSDDVIVKAAKGIQKPCNSLLSTPSNPASLALMAAFLNCSTIVHGSSTTVG